MIFFKMWIDQFLFEQLNIFTSRSDEVDSFEMHEFFPDILYFLDKVDVMPVKFGLCVDYRDDP